MWWVQRPFNSNSIIHIDPVLGTKNAMFIRHQKYQKWAIQEGGILWAGSALWSSAIPAERLSCALSVGNNLVVGEMSTFVLKGDLSVVAQ